MVALGDSRQNPTLGPALVPPGESHRKTLDLFCKLQVPALCQVGLFSRPSLLPREQTVAREVQARPQGQGLQPVIRLRRVALGAWAEQPLGPPSLSRPWVTVALLDSKSP